MSQFSIAIGLVLKPHGVSGELLIDTYGDSLPRIDLPWEVMLSSPKGKDFLSQIDSVRNGPRGKWLVRLKGIDTREEAQLWQGAQVLANEESLPRLADDELRMYELEGAQLEDSQGKVLGTVIEVLSANENAVLSLKTEEYGEVLLPFAKGLIAGFKRTQDGIVLELDATLDWAKFISQEE